jgi:hypothetical protein
MKRNRGRLWQRRNSNDAKDTKGARSRLCTQYIDHLQTVWEEGGIEALRTLCKKDPASLVRTAGSLVPNQFEAGEEATNSFAQVWQLIAGNRERNGHEVIDLKLSACVRGQS